MMLQRTILLVAVACLYILACNEDRCINCDRPAIKGDYTGVYEFVEIENGVDTSVNETQLIKFRLHSDDFFMVMDDSYADSDRVFCDVLGTYKLSTGVELTITDSNSTNGVCNPDRGPGGYFGLDQTTDTMRMLNDQTDSTGIRRVRKLALVQAP